MSSLTPLTTKAQLCTLHFSGHAENSLTNKQHTNSIIPSHVFLD